MHDWLVCYFLLRRGELGGVYSARPGIRAGVGEAGLGESTGRRDDRGGVTGMPPRLTLFRCSEMRAGL